MLLKVRIAIDGESHGMTTTIKIENSTCITVVLIMIREHKVIDQGQQNPREGFYSFPKHSSHKYILKTPILQVMQINNEILQHLVQDLRYRKGRLVTVPQISLYNPVISED